MVAKLLENHEHADAILKSIIDVHHNLADPASIDAITKIIEGVRSEFLTSAKTGLSDPNETRLSDKWSNIYKAIGRCVFALRLHTVPWSRSGFIEMLMKKHELYGAAPITRWGMLGVIIRCDSKWARYLNQVNKAFDDQNILTMEDTLSDILGYCILALAMLDNFKSIYEPHRSPLQL